MWPNPQETADLVTFTEKIVNGKLQEFLLWESLGQKRLKKYKWDKVFNSGPSKTRGR